ncbi:MAG TPA: peptidylprolyl isomerase [bacterium]|nr:peptidylprolyl isomerase [bacterium]HPN43745.1 peptidylprolyl isomerase [bacterium]
MKKNLIIIAAMFILVMSCGQKTPPPPYAADSMEYQFFKTLAEKVPALDPSKSVALVSTKKFNVYSGDIMPFIYARLKRFASNMDALDSSNVNELIRGTSEYMAEKRLLVQDAEANNIKVSEDSLNALLQKYYTQAGGEDKFNERNAQMGLTKEYFIEDVRQSIMIKDYLEQVVYKNMEPTEQELLDEYNKDKFATVRHILMLTNGKSDAEKEEIRKKMETVLEKARAGEDFAALAKEYSEDPGSKDKGGLYENFERGQMVEPFEDASFNLPIGTISDLVETRYGYHIVQVVDRKKEDRPFEEIKEMLGRKLAATKQQNAEVQLLDKLKADNKYKELFSEVL